MMFHEANRMKRLPPYLFTIMDELKREVMDRGGDVIDLGMGSPDQPTPKHVVDALAEAAATVEMNRYSRRDGEIERKLRRAIADWYEGRFNVTLNPETEVLPLIGSKEGVAHFYLSLLNNDDIVLVPSPTYPIHFNGVILAGGILYNIPLNPENGYKPELDKLDSHVVSRSKVLFLCYPHNPTSAVVDLDFFEKVIRWARDKNIVVCHDNAYSDIVFGGYKAPSFLQAKGARKTGIEFHTVSKSYNMAGWRLGFAVGNADILRLLEKTKSYVDFGIFRGVQCAGIAALTGPQDCVTETVNTYEKRMTAFVNGLKSVGWEVPRPKGTFYVWAHIPVKFSALNSLDFCKLMVEETGVVSAPGTGFGEYGEGFLRFALVEREERLLDAVQRIGDFLAIRG
jgi:alanine-synthesizing transaminase